MTTCEHCRFGQFPVVLLQEPAQRQAGPKGDVRHVLGEHHGNDRANFVNKLRSQSASGRGTDWHWGRNFTSCLRLVLQTLSCSKIPVLPFLDFILEKRAGKPPKKQGFFIHRTPKLPEKEGKNAQKNKGFPPKKGLKTCSPVKPEAPESFAMDKTCDVHCCYVHFSDVVH